MKYYISIMQKITGAEEPMHDHSELILELSALCGIVPWYWDIFGQKHETSIETRKAILKAMGLKIDSTAEILHGIQDRKSKPWKQFIDPVQVISVNAQPLAIPVYLPIELGRESGLAISWYLENEEKISQKKNPVLISGSDIRIHATRQIDGRRYMQAFLTDTVQRDIGYYTFHAECRHPEMIFPNRSDKLVLRSRIIVTPDVCYMPPELEHKKVWGLSTNLYALNSRRNWGVGDFTDLRDLVGWLAAAQGSFIGINPLHALPNSHPFGVSPYAPLSRLYRNHIYLDIEHVPEVAESVDLRTEIASEKFRAEIKKIKRKEFIDYEAVTAIKEKVLRKAFNCFFQKHYTGKTKRGRDFQAYVSAEGPALESFSLFLALWKHMKRTRSVFSWRNWPEEYQRLEGEAVRKFGKRHVRELLYFQYVQWLIDTQMKELSLVVKEHHMPVGLYFDLAVGSVGDGSDAWSYKEVMAHGAQVGAPPDDFSPDGQRWGFPPLIPEKLRESGYEFFRRTIQKNMKYGGAIRIDHALGLFRIFWVPDGIMPKDGAYVEQPSEDLLRIIALESVRNRAVVIAEDLGTIGENVREILNRFRMLSYRLFYFERNYPDPSFLTPDKYPETALCAVTTHDLPTLSGYWRAHDIAARRRLGTYADAVWQKHLKDRERDRKLILSALRSQGLIPDDYPEKSENTKNMSSALCLAIYRYLDRTPCKLLLVSLDDVIGTLEQQNLPGTVDEHPNWIQKTPISLAEILEDQRLIDLASALKNRGS
jgi:4-alpha-glucanotransferase